MKREQLLGRESLVKKMDQIKETMKTTTGTEPENGKTFTKTQPKLFISGQLNRKHNIYVLRSLALLDALNKDLKKYCRGGENAIINYLIREGLEKVKKLPTMINVDASDIEK